MRRLLVRVFVGSALACLLASGASAFEQATYLTVSARDTDERTVVRTVRVIDSFFHVGVLGGYPYELLLESSYPLEPVWLGIAVSDGQLLVSPNNEFEHTCPYLIPYYALAIAVYPDGVIEGFSFYINPAWRADRVEEIPAARPELECPVADDPAIDALVRQWWRDVVIAAEGQSD